MPMKQIKFTTAYIALFWILALLWIAESTLECFNNGYFNNQFIAFSRLFVPFFGIIFISLVEEYFKLKLKSLGFVIFRRIFAIPFLTLGLNWICIFTLTQYRSHHRVIIIPLAIVFIAIGLTLTHYNVYQDNE